MIPDERDTIAAPATAIGPGGRGVVRLTGPASLDVLARLTTVSKFAAPSSPRRLAGLPIGIELAGRQRSLEVDVWVWPTSRSYTRQPTVELHTHAAQPIVDAVVRACCRQGARLATPGEFTLRAFLSGRIDLTQAEAVLGVIDARGEAALDHALSQLAGGLSTPLHALREDVTQLLAELEAGLDFVDEEDIRFIEPEELAKRVVRGRDVIRAVIDQATQRADSGAWPTVVLAGLPNAGKSRLFNALRERFGEQDSATNAIVSPQAGTTRDTLTALLSHGGVRFWLVDTAGVGATPRDQIDAAAIGKTDETVQAADLVLRCTPAGSEPSTNHENEINVATKADRLSLPLPSRGSGALLTSAATGTGLDELSNTIATRLANLAASQASVAAGVNARCREALAASEAALARAEEIALAGADELVAEELRQALAALGDVVGETVTDDLLDRIFGQFCIGK